jgi:hypothetical protein
MEELPDVNIRQVTTDERIFTVTVVDWIGRQLQNTAIPDSEWENYA